MMKLLQAFFLRNLMLNQICIHVFKVCQNQQLLNSCIIPNISLLFRVLMPPLFCSNTKERNIQNICLICIYITLLVAGQLRRKQILFDCIGMYPVVCTSQKALDRPIQHLTMSFVTFQSLVITDDI